MDPLKVSSSSFVDSMDVFEHDIDRLIDSYEQTCQIHLTNKHFLESYLQLLQQQHEPILENVSLSSSHSLDKEKQEEKEEDMQSLLNKKLENVLTLAKNSRLKTNKSSDTSSIASTNSISSSNTNDNVKKPASKRIQIGQYLLQSSKQHHNNHETTSQPILTPRSSHVSINQPLTTQQSANQASNQPINNEHKANLFLLQTYDKQCKFFSRGKFLLLIKSMLTMFSIPLSASNVYSSIVLPTNLSYYHSIYHHLSPKVTLTSHSMDCSTQIMELFHLQIQFIYERTSKYLQKERIDLYKQDFLFQWMKLHTLYAIMMDILSMETTNQSIIHKIYEINDCQEYIWLQYQRYCLYLLSQGLIFPSTMIGNVSMKHKQNHQNSQDNLLYQHYLIPSICKLYNFLSTNQSINKQEQEQILQEQIVDDKNKPSQSQSRQHRWLKKYQYAACIFVLKASP